ncbi:MAG: ribbon-helix-helix domain-containing protein [Caulobacteraceae bacterium]
MTRPSGQKKRSISLAGHATSIALESAFWSVLEETARSRGMSLARLVQEIDARRGNRPLASACRLAALEFAQAR